MPHFTLQMPHLKLRPSRFTLDVPHTTLHISRFTLPPLRVKRTPPARHAAFDQGAITRTCALELTHVKPARQKEILTAMKGYKDYSVAFAQSLILKTPPPLRAIRKGRKRNPWNKTAQRKNDLLKKLAEAEQKHDFYSRLYKQYTVDLLRLAIYARALLTNRRIREHLDQSHSEIVVRFETIIAEAKG